MAFRDAEPRASFGQLVTPDLFDTLGVQPRFGRGFAAGEEHAVVLSDALWREAFQSDPHVLGAPVTLNNEPYTVVGVMPAGFEYPEARYRLWVPADISKGLFQKFPDAHLLHVVARIRPARPRAALQADADAFTRHLAQTDPNGRRRIYTLDLQTAVTGDFERPLLILMAAVGALLLIACANVANLVLRARHFPDARVRRARRHRSPALASGGAIADRVAAARNGRRRRRPLPRYVGRRSPASG